MIFIRGKITFFNGAQGGEARVGVFSVVVASVLYRTIILSRTFLLFILSVAHFLFGAAGASILGILFVCWHADDSWVQ